jgi:CDP-6-deoxy-D-xylo-4-hexulose-3-dehydrase
MTLPSYIPNYSNFVLGQTPILYSGPYWDHREINAATEALTSGRWITSGEYVTRFQNEFSRKFNVRHSYMVNSGSSANLAMIAAVKKRLGWKDGDEIIVSPVGFPTTVAPIVQNGLKPVFADIEMNTLNFDLAEVAEKITDKTMAIFVSPVLGNVPNIYRLKDIVEEYGLIKILGDNCDSLGSRWRGRAWTDFCYVSSCSFYAAHHICTGEGGMVSTNDPGLIELAQSFASWGRDCWCVGAANTLPCGTCGKRFSDWFGDGSIVDHKYIFANMGYNLKPLDLQGAIGLVQLSKFDEIENRRRANFQTIRAFFDGNERVRVARTEEGSDPSWFGVPLICDTEETKNSLVSHFETHKIQTRPYFAGNLLRHPGFRHLGNAVDFPNADQAMKRVFFLGCAPHYNRAILTYIGDVINAWK